VRLVDLGGGTGNFTQALVDFNALQQRPLCVDPFQEMLDRAVGYPAVDTCCCGAVEFAQQVDRTYDRVLLKVRRRRPTRRLLFEGGARGLLSFADVISCRPF
jgi:hypothetical protein